MTQPIIEKIRKLQALAERAGTEAEAANAAARVSELLLKHNLEIGCILLEQEEGVNQFPEGQLSREVHRFHWPLAHACSELFDVKTYLDWRIFHFVGLTANVEAACATFSFFCSAVDDLLLEWKKTQKIEAWERRRAYQSFRLGVAERIREMASAHKKRSVKESTGSEALVRVAMAVAERVYSKVPSLRNIRTRRRKSLHYAAFEEGYSQGEKVDLLGARAKRLLT